MVMPKYLVVKPRDWEVVPEVFSLLRDAKIEARNRAKQENEKYLVTKIIGIAQPVVTVVEETGE